MTTEAYSYLRQFGQPSDREIPESAIPTQEYLMQLVKKLQYDVIELRARVRALERRCDTVENCYLQGEGELFVVVVPVTRTENV